VHFGEENIINATEIFLAFKIVWEDRRLRVMKSNMKWSNHWAYR